MKTTDEPVAHLDDLDEGAMKMIKIDGHRVCLVRTSSGVHALDHACPHEGYGLTQGNLADDVLTCAWHNWKFRVDDGSCVLGEESVRVHDVGVAADGAISVRLNRPDPAAMRPQLEESLRRGIENDYLGQMSRDVVRLLKAGAEPADIMWVAVEYGAPRADGGWGHPIASATDCLAMVDLWDGDERALPLVQGIAGIAEQERGRPPRALPDLRHSDSADTVHGPASMHGFRDAIEREDVDAAQSILLAALRDGATPDEIRPWFTAVVSAHHLSYGHGAIYSQKAFELLEMVGWARADTVLAHLVPTIVHGTREDTLPYMKPFMRAVGDLDLVALADVAATGRREDWRDDGALRHALLGEDRVAPVAAVARSLQDGAGVDRVLDAVVDAVSERLLRYDVSGELDFSDDFGWLDITHGLTYAHAVRWHHDHEPTRADLGPELIRLTCFTAFLAHWTGRHEWHTSVLHPAEVTPISDDVDRYGGELQRRAQLDGTTAFIVHAHAVKTSRAAAIEAKRRNTTLPLDATAHFMFSPKLERFVAANVTRSIEFLDGRARRD